MTETLRVGSDSGFGNNNQTQAPRRIPKWDCATSQGIRHDSLHFKSHRPFWRQPWIHPRHPLPTRSQRFQICTSKPEIGDNTKAIKV
ncbi:MAG TPA: hypothetical protein DDX19_25680 [Rhodopirellula baltica]|nr:hypothetical protein [Rhodopirellula baltica]